MNRIILLNLVFLLVVSCPAEAGTITVKADGTGDYPTIQAAIDDCNVGDVILLADGTYSGHGNRDIDFLGKAITVRSTDPNDPNIVAATIIDCDANIDDQHRGFYFHNGEDANSILNGLTIITGYVPSGGGIYCLESSPTIKNCYISNNSADYGGGICCGENSSPTISNCVISGNVDRRNRKGGGIYSLYSNPIITSCTIIGNYARPDGGGIYCRYSTAIISNCTISRNWGDSGGGISFRASNVTITNCTITENMAARDAGGGILCSYNSNATITDCIIRDNLAEFDGGGIRCYKSSMAVTNCLVGENMTTMGCGGGIYSSLSSCTITNCVISTNATNNSGGGIVCVDSNSTITNCTISDNSASHWGGGIGMGGGGNSTITNCIIWNNAANWGDAQLYNSPDPNYSCIQDWTGGGVGNIDADPRFALSTDYHLLPGSPCIDAGTNDPCGGLPVTDKDGITRPLDGDGDSIAVADMGAYEFTRNSPAIAVSADNFYFTQNWPKPEAQSLLIRNCGDQPLHWEIVEDCNWLEVSPTNGLLTDNVDKVTIKANPNGLARSIYNYTFKVQETNASNSPVAIRVIMPVGGILRFPSQDLPTIQSAIDAANPFDTVVVSDGTYTGEGNRYLEFTRRPPITLTSENGPENCIIDCENSQYGLLCYRDGTNSLIDGFTITNASTAGVSCRGGRLTITNCRINNNTSAGIESVWASGLTITNCTINDNSYGIGCGESMLRVSNCSIKNNSHIYGGVGLSGSGSKLTITKCSISNNNGCGFEGDGSILRIKKCNIRGNGDSGIFSDRRNILMISDSIISENFPKFYWAKGGAIYSMDSTVSITNCTIADNKAADEYGSGVSCWDSELKIKNSILYDNEVPIGPAMYLGSDSIAWVNYTDVQGGPNDVYVRPGSILNWGAGNIDEDPCFVEPGYWVDACDPNIIVEPNDPNAMLIEGDYHLLEGSPCVDAGDPNYAAGAAETDLDGYPRVVDGDNDGNSIVDMGAYEVQVAEPAELVAELLEEVAGLGLTSGIENSLMAKLNSALGALEDENDNNDNAAINTLGAFINAVEAQRGKKIPQAEADDLIAAAQQIINLLSNG